MAHSFDTNLNVAESSADPIDNSYTVGASGTILVVMITVTGATRAGGAPTYNGVDLDQAGSNEASAEGEAELWYMLDPPVSTSLTVSVPNTGADDCVVTIASFISGTGATALDTNNQTNNTTQNPSLAITSSTSSGFIISVLFSGHKDAPFGANRTSIREYDTGQEGGAVQYYLNPPASPQSMFWQTNDADDWAIVNAAFKEAVAAAKVPYQPNYLRAPILAQ